MNTHCKVYNLRKFTLSSGEVPGVSKDINVTSLFKEGNRH